MAPATNGFTDQLCVSVRYAGADTLSWSHLATLTEQDQGARDKVISLDLCGNRVQDLSGLDGYVYLLSLSLAQNGLASLSPGRFPFTLTHLDLSNNGLASLDGLQGLPYLTWLDASHNKIESVQPLAQCYRLRILLLSNNEISSVFGLEALLDCERAQLHGNAIARESELRLLATLPKLKHLTLRDNPISHRMHLKAKVTHIMPALVSLDGQPLRAGPHTTAAAGRRAPGSPLPGARGALGPPAPADKLAEFDSVFRAPLFDPPGTLDPADGEPLDECDELLDVDYAPAEALSWLNHVVDEVSDLFGVDFATRGDGEGVPSTTQRTLLDLAHETLGEEMAALRAGSSITPTRQTLYRNAARSPRTPQSARAAARPPWTPPRSMKDARPSPHSPRTEESMGRHVARLNAAREQDDMVFAPKSLRHWSWASPLDNSTIMGTKRARSVSPRVDAKWLNRSFNRSSAPRTRRSQTTHLERMRRAQSIGVERERGRELPGFQNRAAGHILAPKGGTPMNPTTRHMEAIAQHADRVRFAKEITEEEGQGRPLPGFSWAPSVSLGDGLLGAGRGADVSFSFGGSKPFLSKNSIHERVARRKSGGASLGAGLKGSPSRNARGSRGGGSEGTEEAKAASASERKVTSNFSFGVKRVDGSRTVQLQDVDTEPPRKRSQSRSQRDRPAEDADAGGGEFGVREYGVAATPAYVPPPIVETDAGPAGEPGSTLAAVQSALGLSTRRAGAVGSRGGPSAAGPAPAPELSDSGGSRIADRAREVEELARSLIAAHESSAGSESDRSDTAPPPAPAPAPAPAPPPAPPAAAQPAPPPPPPPAPEVTSPRPPKPASRPKPVPALGLERIAAGMYTEGSEELLHRSASARTPRSDRSSGSNRDSARRAEPAAAPAPTPVAPAGAVHSSNSTATNSTPVADGAGDASGSDYIRLIEQMLESKKKSPAASVAGTAGDGPSLVDDVAGALAGRS